RRDCETARDVARHHRRESVSNACAASKIHQRLSGRQVMKTPAENSREAVDRFLGNLGEPLSPLHVERAIARVRNRLDDAEALSISASTSRTTTSLRWSTAAAAVLVMLVGGAVQMLFLRPGTT